MIIKCPGCGKVFEANDRLPKKNRDLLEPPESEHTKKPITEVRCPRCEKSFPIPP